MKRDAYLQTFVLVLTVVVVGLVLTAQSSGNQSLTSSPTTAATSSLPPGCKFIWCEDVNGCGVTYDFWCNPGDCDLVNDSGPQHRGQCVLCRIGQFEIRAYQGVRQWWYDCTGDGKADCEYRYWVPLFKGIVVCVE